MTAEDEQTTYRAIAEMTADYAYVCRVSPGGGLTPEWVSEGFTRLTGYTLTDMAAQGWQSQQAARKAEFRLVAKNGDALWVREQTQPLGEDRIVGAGWDMTERQSAEQDLQFAVDAADLGTFYCEWPFDKIVWNETCKQHFFLPPDAQVDFDLFYSLLHPEDRDRVRESINRAIEENTEYNVEYRVSAPGRRQTRWINAIGRARYDPDMVPIRFDGITIDVTARKQAELDLADALRRETLVNEIGHAIRRAQNPDAVLANSVEALGQALHADRCYYVTYDLEQGRGTLGPDWHRADLESIAGGYHFSDFNFNHDPAYLLGQTHVVEDSLALPGDAPPARLGLRSLVRAPLAPGRMMTALAVAMAETPRRWTANEIRLVEAVASQTQAALEAARVQQREHRIATALQTALQPPVPEDIPRLRVAAYTRPALDEAAVGGDFFDVFALDKELYALVIGDVSGKGLAAAAQLAAVRNMLRGVLFQYRNAAAAVTSLNTVMTAHDLLAGFVTLFVGLYDAHTGQITYASCGHEPGLLHHAGLGLVERLEPTGLPLGVAENADYEEQTVTLLAGDMLLLYTDGLSEAGPNRLELLGTEGMIRLLLAQADQTEVGRGAMQIVSEAHAFAQGVFRDDVCVLLLRRQGEDMFPIRRLSRQRRAMTTYCQFAPTHPLHQHYHDTQYGFPLRGDAALLERLALEINQAGLSWQIILRKQPDFFRAYEGFDLDTIAAYGDAERARLLADAGIVRNRLKVNAVIENARRLTVLRAEHGSFADWLDGHHPLSRDEWRRLFKKTFVFTGGEIVNEFLMSTGYLPGAHEPSCPVYHQILALNPPWRQTPALKGTF